MVSYGTDVLGRPVGHSFKDCLRLEGGTVVPKRRYFINLGCATSQKNVYLIYAARQA